MKFTAVAVREGDCFLTEYLKDEKTFRILIDGGKYEEETTKLFNRLKLPNKHINLIICTHYDSDHINGLIGLLNAGYTFDEIWLPEIIGSVAASIGSKCIREVVEEIDKISKEEFEYLKDNSDEYSDEYLKSELEEDLNYNQEFKTNIMSNFNLDNIGLYKNNSFSHSYRKSLFYYNEYGNATNIRFERNAAKCSILDTLSCTSELLSLIALSTYSESKIVWLRNTTSLHL